VTCEFPERFARSRVTQRRGPTQNDTVPRPKVAHLPAQSWCARYSAPCRPNFPRTWLGVTTLLRACRRKVCWQVFHVPPSPMLSERTASPATS